MSDPTLLPTKTSLPIDQIVVRDRLRPVSPAGVATIVASLRELGHLTNPVVVRQVRRKGDITYRVLDGGHRLAAVSELGWTDVPVRVFECTDDQARLIEIDGNLAGAELNPLDTAVFLATRKAVYERLHPESRHGGDRRSLDFQTDIESVCFSAVTAEKFGMTERHVRRLIAAGIRLGPDEVVQLRQAPRQVTLKDLQDIAKVNAPDRYRVVAALAEGRAKTAAHAIKGLKPGSEAPVKDPVEEQFLALMKAWNSSNMAARRRFVSEHFENLGLLCADEEQARFEAEKPALVADLAAMRAKYGVAAG